MLLASVTLWSAALTATVEPPRYRVKLASDPQRFVVDACFPDGPPERLRSGSRDAAEHLIGARYGTTPVRVRGRTMQLPRDAEEGCLQYEVDLDSARAASGRRAEISRRVEAILFKAQDWLWQPRGPIEVEFDLPQGQNVSVPWPSAGGEHRFRVDAPMSDWSNLMALGEFSVERVPVGDRHLRMAILSGPSSAQVDRSELKGWVRANAEAVAQIYGRFPLPETQVLIVPISTGGAVPWAQVHRGGATSVHFFINERRTHDEFMEDWTAAHEFSHTLHPYLSGGGRWVSEGLASYYQNVARARAGLITEEDGWRKLEAGFERGRKAATRTPLGRAIRSGRERRNYMRIYWSGAALAFRGDVELRRRSGGEKSLDTALQAFADCCLPANRAWGAREFLGRLDELTGETVFVPLFDEIESAPGFPDVNEAYASAGIRFSGTRPSFSRDGEASELRQAIMGSRPFQVSTGN